MSAYQEIPDADFKDLPDVFQPIPNNTLQQIVDEVCKNSFGETAAYDHNLVCTEWNQHIPTNILSGISEELRTIEGGKYVGKYKFTIHSAIIQHTAPFNQLDPETKEPIKEEENDTAADGSPRSSPDHKVTLKHESKGKRGLHVATCAIWNTDTDGLFNTKYDPGEGKDWDVIISIMWLTC